MKTLNHEAGTLYQALPNYWVTETGEVYSTKVSQTPRRMKPGIKNDGRKLVQVYLSNDGTHKQLHVHDLVMLAFVGEKPEGLVIRHLDGNNQNNHKDNLCYGTRSENLHDMVRHGTHPLAKLTSQQVKDIQTSYNKGGITQRQLAREYGLSQATVWWILHKEKI